MDKLGLGIVVGASLSGGFASVFKGAEKSNADLGKVIAKTQKQLGDVKAAQKYKTVLEELRKKQSKLTKESPKLERGIRAVEAKYKKASIAVANYGFKVKNLARTETVLQTALKKTEAALARRKQLDKNRSTRQGLQGRVGGVIAAGYSAGRVLGGGLDVARSGVLLETVINADDTLAALKKSRRHAMNFALDSMADEVELIDIEYALNSAGLDAELSRFGSEVVHKVAKVTQGEGAQVGEVMGIVFNNMSESIAGTAKEKLSRIGDILTKTQFKFQIRDFGQLGESFAKGAKSAVRYKVSLDQTAAVLGQLNSAGVQGSLAGTSFNAILRQMTTASDDFGFAIVRDNKGQLDLIKTIGNLGEALDEYSTDTDERATAIQKSFGDEGGSVSLLIDQYKKLVENHKAVKDSSQGLVNKSYEKFLKSAPGQVERFWGQLKIVGNVLAGTILPVLTAVLEPITGLMKYIAIGIDHFPILGTVIGTAGLAIAGFIVTAWAGKFIGTLFSDAWLLSSKTVGFFSSVIGWSRAKLVAFNATALITGARMKAMAVGSVISSFGAVLMGFAGRILPFVATAWKGLNIAFMTSPIGLIIGGIALAAGLIITNWETVKTWFTEFFGWIGKAWGWISSLWGGDDQKSIEMTAAKTVDVGAAVKTFKPVNDNEVSQIGGKNNTSSITSLASRKSTSSNNSQVKTGGGITINVYAQAGQDANEIAELVMQKLKAAQNSNLYDEAG